MDLTQVGRRIFMQHWRMILVCIAAALGALLLLETGRTSTYTAHTRLVLDTEDPTTRQEAAAIADTVKAIASSPEQVTIALKKASIEGRDPTDIAKHRVTVQSLGSSNLVDLSVSDRSAEGAAAIANALGTEVIRARLEVRQGDLRTILGDLDRRITRLRARARREAATQVGGASAPQVSALESDRVQLLAQAGANPKPAIVSRATPPKHPDPSGLWVRVILALMLGLVSGVALAGLRETFRPTVVGSDAVAREFDAPLLGTLSSVPDDPRALADVSRVADRLRLVKGPLGNSRVQLLGAGPDVDLQPLAQGLGLAGTEAPAPVWSPVPARSAASPSGHWDDLLAEPDAESDALHEAADGHFYDVPDGAANGGGAAQVLEHGQGVVLVAPTTLSMADISETTRLLRVIPGQLLGIITYVAPKPRLHRPCRAQPPRQAAAGHPLGPSNAV
jgi:capsular polysaccharide biosynthesis protein